MPDGKRNLSELIDECDKRSSITRAAGKPAFEITHDEFESLSNAALLCMADNPAPRKVVPIREVNGESFRPGGDL